MGGIGTQLGSLPLIKQADMIEVWFAGRADFGPEQERTGDTHFRAAGWDTVRPGDCSIKEAQITIRRDGGLSFSARVKSKDEGDRYCVILNLVDHSRVNVWRSSKICTPFELNDGFSSWVDTSLSFPQAQYRFIAFATREDYC
jgi:hypothetical protein